MTHTLPVSYLPLKFKGENIIVDLIRDVGNVISHSDINAVPGDIFYRILIIRLNEMHGLHGINADSVSHTDGIGHLKLIAMKLDKCRIDPTEKNKEDAMKWCEKLMNMIRDGN